MAEDTRGFLDALATPEFRLRWWRELERGQPEVAARLVARFPDRYPVKEEET